ncbi:MAG: GNAT family N-acetyltransferase [Myxococcales bacterium]|nr:GNAT family N-acetyltransferase [Myxococcales bacterium]
MDTKATIRGFCRSNLDALLRLYRHLHERDEAPPPRAELERIWNGLVDDVQQLYLGAFVGEQLVSACNAAIVPNLTRGARPYAVVQNVVTDPQHRRRGIGSATLEALIGRCRARRCYKIMWMSATGRDSAHAFYTRIGFDPDAKQAFVYKP